jgi:hypothetical protein
LTDNCGRPIQSGIEREKDMENPASRFFGGPPLAVVARLILLSILIGVVLAAFGLDPLNIIDSVRRLIWRIWDMGFEAIAWLWRYFLLGAVIVIPIWLIVRLVNAPRGR